MVVLLAQVTSSIMLLTSRLAQAVPWLCKHACQRVVSGVQWFRALLVLVLRLVRSNGCQTHAGCRQVLQATAVHGRRSQSQQLIDEFFFFFFLRVVSCVCDAAIDYQFSPVTIVARWAKYPCPNGAPVPVPVAKPEQTRGGCLSLICVKIWSATMVKIYF